MKHIIILTILIATGLKTSGQVSFSVSPSKVYFEVPYQGTGRKAITVQNNGSEKRSYSVSFMAWERNASGKKHFSPDTGQVYSCARMLVAEPDVFNLEAGEKQVVNITITHNEKQKQPSLWAMGMIRELNQAPAPENSEGVSARINVEYQIGIHVYQQLAALAENGMELELDTMFVSGSRESKKINVQLANNGKLIAEGRLALQLFSMNSNEKSDLPVHSLTLLPEHSRTIAVALPRGLEPGDYTVSARFDPGYENNLLVGDFFFSIPAK